MNGAFSPTGSSPLLVLGTQWQRSWLTGHKESEGDIVYISIAAGEQALYDGGEGLGLRSVTRTSQT